MKDIGTSILILFPALLKERTASGGSGFPLIWIDCLCSVRGSAGILNLILISAISSRSSSCSIFVTKKILLPDMRIPRYGSARLGSFAFSAHTTAHTIKNMNAAIMRPAVPSVLFIASSYRFFALLYRNFTLEFFNLFPIRFS